jgi:uncharacterized membrane protein YcaP (DUF421 family)
MIIIIGIGWVRWQSMRRLQIHATYFFGSLRERDHLEDVSIYGRIII